MHLFLPAFMPCPPFAPPSPIFFSPLSLSLSLSLSPYLPSFLYTYLLCVSWSISLSTHTPTTQHS